MNSLPPIASILLAFGLFVAPGSNGQATVVTDEPESGEWSSAKASAHGPFELLDGDRVVLLGSGFIETEQEFGYLELALSTRWPDRKATFRNVGWSGDTVFGDARARFTNPPSPYERLLDDATAPDPTVIFVGYGSTVPFEALDATGEAIERMQAAVTRFEEGLDRLLDDLERETGARIILLSPPPLEAVMSPAPMNLVRRANEALAEVSEAIARIAGERGHAFVDVFGGLAQTQRRVDAPFTTDGIQLNAAGYYQLARIVEEGLGLKPRGWSVRADASSEEVEADGARILDFQSSGGAVALTIQPQNLSLPPPDGIAVDSLPTYHNQRISITVLPDGAYALAMDGVQMATATAGEWAAGLPIRQPALADSAERLRRLIIQKNRLYFQQYRPPNETYLVGFRSYEQGQNADELERLTPLIEEKEREMARLMRPATLTLKLEPTGAK